MAVLFVSSTIPERSETRPGVSPDKPSQSDAIICSCQGVVNGLSLVAYRGEVTEVPDSEEDARYARSLSYHCLNQRWPRVPSHPRRGLPKAGTAAVCNCPCRLSASSVGSVGQRTWRVDQITAMSNCMRVPCSVVYSSSLRSLLLWLPNEGLSLELKALEILHEHPQAA
jgi:hypothetical protein